MSNDNRPLSPHLQVYRLPMLAWLSILHRATGVALSVAIVLLPVVLLTAVSGGDYYECLQTHLGAWYGQLVLVLITLSLNYHLCNGVRHLVWDAGRGFELKTADRSGVICVVAALLLTAGVWALALS
ncbi:MAG: succinate dehydrogenase, cytochrome b556 subunit [Pseudomonadota bacterium]